MNNVKFGFKLILATSLLLYSAFIFSCGYEETTGCDCAPKCPAYNPETHFCDSRDFKIYRFAKIGSQTWMAENLNYNSNGSKCGDDPNLVNGNTPTCNTYGRLYTWPSAMAGSCPYGWHIPSKEEWTALTDFINANSADGKIGAKLKAESGWNLHEGAGNGTDDYGFSALPGGYGYYSDFGDANVGRYGNWWSSTEIDSYTAWRLGISYNENDISKDDNNDKEIYLLSVRCIKD